MSQIYLSDCNYHDLHCDHTDEPEIYCDVCENLLCYICYNGNSICIDCDRDNYANLLDDYFKDIKSDVIRVVELDYSQRESLHGYINDNYPGLSTCGVTTKAFKDVFIKHGVECPHCFSSVVVLNTYRLGYAENNKDECWRGCCGKCGESSSYEPNYDDYSFRVHVHNAFLFGKQRCFKPYSSKGKVISSKEVYDMLKDKKVYEIPASTIGNIGVKGLGKHVTNCFKYNKNTLLI